MHLIGTTSADGVLRIEKPNLPRFLWLDANETETLLSELVGVGILKSENGVIEYPRLAHKAKISQIRARAGRMGGRPRGVTTETDTQSN